MSFFFFFSLFFLLFFSFFSLPDFLDFLCFFFSFFSSSLCSSEESSPPLLLSSFCCFSGELAGVPLWLGEYFSAAAAAGFSASALASSWPFSLDHGSVVLYWSCTMLRRRLLTGPSSAFGLLGLDLVGAIKLGFSPPPFLLAVVGMPGGGGLDFLGAGESDSERERLRRSLERDLFRSVDFDLLRPVDLDLLRSDDRDFFRRSVERDRLRSLELDRLDRFLEALLDLLRFLDRDRRERDLRFRDRERREERDRLLRADLERDLRLLAPDRDRDLLLFLDRDLDLLRLRERRPRDRDRLRDRRPPRDRDRLRERRPPRDRDRLRLDRFRDRERLFLERDTDRFFFPFEAERSLADLRSTEDFFFGLSFDTERPPDSDLDLDRSPFFSSSLWTSLPFLSPEEEVLFLSTLVDPFRRSLDRDLERPIFTLL